VRAFDYLYNSTAVVDYLDIEDTDINGDLKVPFQLDPAVVSIVDENMRLIAGGINPTGTASLLKITEVDGISASRLVRSSSTENGQPVEHISVSFVNQSGKPMNLEVRERNGSRLEVTGNRNIAVSKSQKKISPDELDGLISVPIRANQGASELQYKLYHYARK